MKKLSPALLLSVIPLAAGAVSYAFLRVAYVQFYSALDVTPEEVGWGRAELLSQALVGPALVILVVVVAFTLYIAFITIVFGGGGPLWFGAGVASLSLCVSVRSLVLTD